METAPPTKLKPAEEIIDIGLLPCIARRGPYAFTVEPSLPVWDSLLATANADKVVKTPNLFDSDGIPRNNETLIWSTAAAAGGTLGFSADILNHIAYHSVDISGMDHLIVSGSMVTDAAGNLDLLGCFSSAAGMGTTLPVPAEHIPVEPKRQMPLLYQLFSSQLRECVLYSSLMQVVLYGSGSERL